MNESMPRGAPAPPGVDATRHVVETGEEFDVLNWFVRFWWPNRWMVLGSTSVVLVLAAAVASMLPDAYDATASVLVTPSALSAKVGSAPVDLNVYARMAKSGAIIDGAVAEARRMNALGGPEEPQDFRVDVGSQSMLGLSVTARQAAAAG
ncbi:MAG: hypothetical protein HY047_00640, partial [Acidobacteria bacterium]|nr:hypothetical protein [Acidobacteriota bacterium]